MTNILFLKKTAMKNFIHQKDFGDFVHEKTDIKKIKARNDTEAHMALRCNSRESTNISVLCQKKSIN
jgi:hypothetical protein